MEDKSFVNHYKLIHISYKNLFHSTREYFFERKSNEKNRRLLADHQSILKEDNSIDGPPIDNL